ncbi:MAG: triose-phosphate isomerase [Saprospiraceae bacterium]|nr:triose-phosphate isomerase [Saprospiraceae bacterium]
MRRNIAAGNWKMNTTVSEGVELIKELEKQSIPSDVEMIICAPATHLSSLVGCGEIQIGGQNIYMQDKGAFTGEISPLMLVDLGVEYVLVGHSERRELFNEDDQILAQKLNKALEHNLKPIFCFGEPLNIRKEGSHISYVQKQLENGLFHLSEEELGDVVLAYEPIWAIGTGETASPDQAQEMHASIRKSIENKYGKVAADNISILYGGSVKPTNAEEIFAKPDVDGGLVGGASLDAEGFGKIANSF